MTALSYLVPITTLAAAATIAACSVTTEAPLSVPTPTTPDKAPAPDADANAVEMNAMDEDDDAGATDAGPATSMDATHADASTKDASTKDAACTPTTWYADKDGDGFGDPNDTKTQCTMPSGYIAAGGDCDDTRTKVAPNAVEVCDGRDNNCDGTVDGTPTEAAACVTMAGSYPGTYSFYTAEKLGSTVINEMQCTGTSALVVDLSAAIVVHGTVACSYSRSLGGFDRNQTGTIEASLRPDGTIQGTLNHVFYASDGTNRSFPFTGHLTGGKIGITGTGSWLPSSFSAVPWVVTFSVM